MKLSVTKLFSKESLANDILQKIEPLINWLNPLSEQLVRALQNKLSFADNFNCQIKELTDVLHGVTIKVTVAGINPVFTVLPLSILPTGNSTLAEAVPQLAWRINDQGQLEITPYMRSASSTQKYTVSVLILYS